MEGKRELGKTKERGERRLREKELWEEWRRIGGGRVFLGNGDEKEDWGEGTDLGKWRSVH